MTDIRHRPTERDLAALADGSLAPARREQVQRAVAASPELQAELREQRHALDAVRVASAERAPADLRARVAMARPARRPARRGIRALALPGAAAVASAATIAAGVALLGGGASQSASVADAAALGARTPAAAVQEPAHRAATLASPQAAGLRFPYWREHFGWRAIGSRHDRLDGRSATTVFYKHEAQVIAYTIVGGGPLPAGAPARVSVRDGTELRSLTADGRHAVTWLRHGHTCVLSGTHTAGPALLRLAAWRGNGEISF
jgi:anti-sigma factor RsiW